MNSASIFHPCVRPSARPCVSACVRARARPCVQLYTHAGACACTHACVQAFVHACLRAGVYNGTAANGHFHGLFLQKLNKSMTCWRCFSIRGAAQRLSSVPVACMPAGHTQHTRCPPSHLGRGSSSGCVGGAWGALQGHSGAICVKFPVQLGPCVSLPN